jgi:hypothetical protein
VESGPIPSRGSQESCQLTQESSESSCLQHSIKKGCQPTQESSEGRCPQHSSRRAVCSLKNRQKAAVFSTPSREHSAQGPARKTPVESPCWQSITAQNISVERFLKSPCWKSVPVEVPWLVPLKVPVGKVPLAHPCESPLVKRVPVGRPLGYNVPAGNLRRLRYSQCLTQFELVREQYLLYSRSEDLAVYYKAILWLKLGLSHKLCLVNNVPLLTKFLQDTAYL